MDLYIFPLVWGNFKGEPSSLSPVALGCISFTQIQTVNIEQSRTLWSKCSVRAIPIPYVCLYMHTHAQPSVFAEALDFSFSTYLPVGAL